MDNLFEKKGSLEKYASIKSHLLWGDPDAVKSPSISILMPVYANSRYFREALNSALMQDYNGDYEVIVCDNTPLDETKTVFQQIIEEVNDARVLYFRNEQNIGMFPNWNRCFELAKAKYVTYCHDDDKLFLDAISRLLYYQKKHGERAIFPAWCQFRQNREPQFSDLNNKVQTIFGIWQKMPDIRVPLVWFLVSGPGMGGGALFSRRCLIELGGFNEESWPVSDFQLFARYADRFGCVILHRHTYKYRIANNVSEQCWPLFAPSLMIIRREIARRVHIPNFIANRLLMSIFRSHKRDIAMQWATEEREKNVHVGVFDDLIRSQLRKILLLPSYRFKLYKSNSQKNEF